MRKYALLLWIVAASAQDISRDMPYVTAEIHMPPIAVRSGGQYLLEYELFVGNWYEKNLTIRQVEVLGPKSLIKLEGESLDRAFSHVSPKKAVVPPQQSAMLVMAVFAGEVPASLDHRIRFQVEGESEMREIRYLVTPVRKNPVRLRPPLRGDLWAATEGPAASNHHTASPLPFEGRIHIPQRFAIDFVRLYEDHEMSHGDPKDLHSYRCYGEQALAAADAKVAFVRDDIPDQPPLADRDIVPLTAETIGGNRVILDLGNGLFAIYAHLQPKSVRVRAGAAVRSGDVLGLVGNSGSPYPHLHFQVSDGPSVLKNEGIPYVFDSFSFEGKLVHDELPQSSWILDFGRR
jgi:hypothetical protein